VPLLCLQGYAQWAHWELATCVRKVYEWMNTLHQILFLYLCLSYKLHVSNLGPSFSMILYFEFFCSLPKVCSETWTYSLQSCTV
jgi:ABC-type enterochelin transport system permease subunit